jgi:hypothetical protein
VNQYDRQYEGALTREHEAWGVTEPPFAENDRVTVRAKTGRHKGRSTGGTVSTVESAKKRGLIHTPHQKAKPRWFITVSFKTFNAEDQNRDETVALQFVWVPTGAYNPHANETHGRFEIEASSR